MMRNVWLVCATVFFLPPVHLLLNDVQRYRLRDGKIPCEEDWFYFGEKCYKTFGGNMKPYGRLTWMEASKRCDSNGGHLATIHSKEIQDFLLVFQLLTESTEAWIGLNDRQKEGDYVWVDGTTHNYTNWKPREPSGYENDNCVKMLLQVDIGEPGNWKDFDCNKELAYICEVNKGKQLKWSPDPTICSSGMDGGWKFGDSCYKVVQDRMTWNNAEKYCQEQHNGHLVTILNFQVDYFLNYIIENVTTDSWIGIKIKDQHQQQFSSGWPVVHSNWDEPPLIFEDGTCVVRKEGRSWTVVPCSEELPFVCESSNVRRPVLKNPSGDSKCPVPLEDWWDVGGEYCYFMDSANSFNWYRANFECIRRGGSLAIFHSRKEIDALAPYMKHALSRSSSIFIGTYRSQVHENVFLSADGTDIDFTNWSEDAPNNKDEKCGEIYAANMKWNDVKCDTLKGYICSARKISSKTKSTEEVPDCMNVATFKTVIGVLVGIMFIVILVLVGICWIRPWKMKKQKKSYITDVNLHSSRPTILQQMYAIEQRSGQVTVNESEGAYEYID